MNILFSYPYECFTSSRRRFLRWSGLNHSTEFHIRIRGHVFPRFWTGIFVGAIGALLIHLGVKAEPTGWDAIMMFAGFMFLLMCGNVLDPWVHRDDHTHTKTSR